jgi:hypothetical protein
MLFASGIKRSFRQNDMATCDFAFFLCVRVWLGAKLGFSMCRLGLGLNELMESFEIELAVLLVSRKSCNVVDPNFLSRYI